MYGKKLIEGHTNYLREEMDKVHNRSQRGEGGKNQVAKKSYSERKK